MHIRLQGRLELRVITVPDRIVRNVRGDKLSFSPLLILDFSVVCAFSEISDKPTTFCTAGSDRRRTSFLLNS